MVQLTSAEAAKILKKLNEELSSVMRKEEQSKDFLAAMGEDPETVRPKYDYEDTSKKIDEIETKIRLLKHFSGRIMFISHQRTRTTYAFVEICSSP